MKLTAAQQEALKAGKSMEEVLLMAGPVDTTETEAAAAAAKAAEQAAASAGTTKTDATEPTVDSLKAELTTASAKLTEVEGQLTAKDAALTELEAKLADVTAKFVASEAGVKALAAALTPYTERMSVALGKKLDPKTMSASALVETHASLAADFSKNFPGGRRTATGTEAADKGADAKALEDQLALAQAKALKF